MNKLFDYKKYIDYKNTEIDTPLEVKAPNKIPDVDAVRVFLAGSIEQGKAKKWHQTIVDSAKGVTDKEINLVLLNPRRDDWDSSWVQDIDKNEEFRTQVDWEMTGIASSDIVLINFEDETKSPITLLELGFVAGLKLQDDDIKVIVRCSPKFWRYGNVQYVCKAFDFTHVETMDELVKEFGEILKEII